MMWTQKPTIEKLEKMGQGNMVSHLGIEILEVGDDFLTARMPVDHRTKQPMGLLHGGASVVLAETLGSVASAYCMKESGKMPVGIEINANHMKSATSGFVIGTVRPVRVGGHLHVWNIEIKNEQNELVCVSRLTVMIVDQKSRS